MASAAEIWLSVARRIDACRMVILHQSRRTDSADEVRAIFDRELGALTGWLYQTALRPPSQVDGDRFEDENTPTLEIVDADLTPVDE